MGAPSPHARLSASVSPRRPTEPSLCTICLSTISERAVASPCNHLEFDFHCLVQWLQASTACPLCKAEIQEVQYDFRSPVDYKRYRVPKALQEISSAASAHTSRTPAATADRCVQQESVSLKRRRQVYDTHSFSAYVGSNAFSGYTDFTPQDFVSSPALQAKARLFLRRELCVLGNDMSDPASTATIRQGRAFRRNGPATTIEYMIEYVVFVLKIHDAKSFDGRAQELVAEFVGENDARLLLHELSAWLRSPFSRLQEWDDVVQYNTQ